MKPLYKNPLLVTFLLLGLIYYYVGPNSAMLFFTLAWQIVIALSVVKFIRIIRKTRSGVFVHGEVVSSTETENDSGNKEYKVVVEFAGPDSEHKHQIEHRTDKLPSEPYKLWFDKSDPKASIVIEGRKGLILFTVLSFVVILSLCYVDYLYLVKIFVEKSL